MIDPDDHAIPTNDEVVALAELINEISSRLEAGDTVEGAELGADPNTFGVIRQLLPTVRTMVALADRIAFEEGSRTRSRKKKNDEVSPYLDANS
jgi:hypothetical protein